MGINLETVDINADTQTRVLKVPFTPGITKIKYPEDDLISRKRSVSQIVFKLFSFVK